MFVLTELGDLRPHGSSAADTCQMLAELVGKDLPVVNLCPHPAGAMPALQLLSISLASGEGSSPCTHPSSPLQEIKFNSDKLNYATLRSLSGLLSSWLGTPPATAQGLRLQAMLSANGWASKQRSGLSAYFLQLA